MVLQPRQDDAHYQRDATFCAAPGLADSGAVSYRAMQFPRAYLRHAFGVLRLSDNDGSGQFARDATF
ncbi:hypothetical protein GCM10011609_88080 [Lentzea pudingi]|uniref:Alpha-L-arabinofuranosidase B arabinose-binding domain-containing protein n=1 Tax=Lentzea pudingi TaxID=1789439 RepID=A0ABQ2IX45_9PSEU|nr:hypothetical protein GCM10011609_88080 [Lentzea pudingi]